MKTNKAFEDLVCDQHFLAVPYSNYLLEITETEFNGIRAVWDKEGSVIRAIHPVNPGVDIYILKRADYEVQLVH